MSERPHVICICGGDGYPKGSATAVRITLVGKALQAAGLDFEVLHCGPSPTGLNTSRVGEHDGIRFRYTTFLRRPANWLLRVGTYAIAVGNLTCSLFRRRIEGRPVVYLYVMQGSLNLYVGTLCRLLGLPLIQELCEWWPGEPTCSRLTHFLYRHGIVFRNATGVIAISREIEERTQIHAARNGVHPLVMQLPAIADTARFPSVSSATLLAPQKAPYEFVWCGTVDGWIRDVLFLMSAVAKVVEKGHICRLIIVGMCSAAAHSRISEHKADLGLSDDLLTLTGWVSDERLSCLYRSAAALLMPLWTDDRSLTRMPNKLPEYLCSGRMIISSSVGSVVDLLEHNENACLVPPGDCESFADAMIRVIQSPKWAIALGRRGRDLGVKLFDYRSFSNQLGDFFAACVVHTPAPYRSGSIGGRAQVTLRNWGCSAVGLFIIGTGAVRRAKARAMQPGIVTAIYFHKPNRKLFLQCIRWLRENGYHLISVEELLDFFHQGRALPAGATWLSFDDSAVEVYRLCPDLLEKRIPATIFVPSGIVAGDGLFPWISPRLGQMGAGQSQRHAVTVPELRSMAEIPGVTIGSHSVTHSKLSECSAEELSREIGGSKRMLEEWIDRPVQIFSYPNGDFDQRSAPYLKEHGYELAVTTQSAFTDVNTDAYHVPRFSIADNILLPEAICNMTGLWRPWVEPVKRFATRLRLAPIFKVLTRDQ